MESITWNKLKQDQYGYFVKPLYEQELIERDLKSWDLEIVNAFYNGNYISSTPIRLSVPKKGFLVRPAIVLSLRDNYVYNLFFDEIVIFAYSKLEPFKIELILHTRFMIAKNTVYNFRIVLNVGKNTLLYLKGKLC